MPLNTPIIFRVIPINVCAKICTFKTKVSSGDSVIANKFSNFRIDIATWRACVCAINDSDILCLVDERYFRWQTVTIAKIEGFSYIDVGHLKLRSICNVVYKNNQPHYLH